MTFLRNALLQTLANRCTRTAFAAVQRIEQAFPSKDWIVFTRIHAEEQMLKGTWRPLTPEQVIELESKWTRKANSGATGKKRESASKARRRGSIKCS